MGHGKAAVGAVGHEIASNLSVHFSISHGEEKGFRYENPLFVKYMITMCNY